MKFSRPMIAILGKCADTMYVRELNWAEPVSAMQCLADQPQLSFLDSALHHEQLGRYSYIACDPFGHPVCTENLHIDDEVRPVWRANL
jgi:hypothetical protein